MRKEYQRRAQLAVNSWKYFFSNVYSFSFIKKFDDRARKNIERIHQEALSKKKLHPKVNHPGSVDQMEEVWEQVDRLEAEQFTPKSFFKLHDINGDGLLDDAELEAIMLKEVWKEFF